MMVLKLYMWPLGHSDRERFLGAALIDCQGQAVKDLPEQGVRRGERAYRVRLLKMPRFGGPSEEQLTQTPRKRDIWRTGFVRGHLPGKRGTWDLIGGALREMLGRRLDPYVSFTPRRPAQAEPLDMENDVSEKGSTENLAALDALRRVLAFIADPTASDHDIDAAAVHLDDEDAARIDALLRSVSRHRRNGR